MAKKPAKKTSKPVKKSAAKKVAARPAQKGGARAASAGGARSGQRVEQKRSSESRSMGAEGEKTRTLVPPRNSATKSYSQSEFIENVKNFCGWDKRSQAKEVLTDINEFVQLALKKGYKIPLLGLGKLFIRESKARTGRNPATGQEIQIPARKRIRFTPAKALKDQVLTKR